MSNIFQIASARVLGGGEYRVTAPWSCDPHYHPNWEFLYYTEGTWRIDTPEVTVYPRQHELVIYPPGLPHIEMTSDSAIESWYCVGVQVKATLPVGSHRVLVDHHGEFGWLIERIIKEIDQRTVSPLAHAYLQPLLHLIERDWEQGVAVQHHPVDVAVHYLHTHYNLPITLETLAEITRLSVYRLAHSFRDRMGVSPMRYLQQIRLEKAKMLLQVTEEPINEIARKVGYTDIFHFSRVFKQVVNQSPSAYRTEVRRTLHQNDPDLLT